MSNIFKNILLLIYIVSSIFVMTLSCKKSETTVVTTTTLSEEFVALREKIVNIVKDLDPNFSDATERIYYKSTLKKKIDPDSTDDTETNIWDDEMFFDLITNRIEFAFSGVGIGFDITGIEQPEKSIIILTSAKWYEAATSPLNITITQTEPQKIKIETDIKEGALNDIPVEYIYYKPNTEYIEATETTEIQNTMSKASEYHLNLDNFLGSPEMQSKTTSNLVGTEYGSAGSLKTEFPGGKSESVSGYSVTEIFDDKEFLNYGYNGLLFIDKNKSEAISYFGEDFEESNNQLLYDRSSLIFEYDANGAIKKIYITPNY